MDNDVHPILQTFFPNDAVLQEDKSPIHTAGTVQSLFEVHEGELQHLPWPAQSPEFNINEQLWSVLETRMRNRFPPPTSLKATCKFSSRRIYKILLETVQNLQEFISRRTAAVLKAKDGPKTY
jgi:hypothetical protein